MKKFIFTAALLIASFFFINGSAHAQIPSKTISVFTQPPQAVIDANELNNDLTVYGFEFTGIFLKVNGSVLTGNEIWAEYAFYNDLGQPLIYWYVLFSSTGEIVGYNGPHSISFSRLAVNPPKS